MKTITGNTYPVKEQLKALGAQWNKTLKGWDVPDDKVAEAEKLVASAPPSQPRRQSFGRGHYAPGRRRCPYCGSSSCAKAWNPRDLCDND